MNALVLKAGQLSGLLGIVLIAVSAVARLMGMYTLQGLSTGTMMLAGIGAVSVGCFLLLWRLAAQAQE